MIDFIDGDELYHLLIQAVIDATVHPIGGGFAMDVARNRPGRLTIADCHFFAQLTRELVERLPPSTPFEAIVVEMIGRVPTAAMGGALQADRIAIIGGEMKIQHARMMVIEPYYEGMRVGVNLAAAFPTRHIIYEDDEQLFVIAELEARGFVPHTTRTTLINTRVVAPFIKESELPEIRHRTAVIPVVFNPPVNFADGLRRPSATLAR